MSDAEPTNVTATLDEDPGPWSVSSPLLASTPPPASTCPASPDRCGARPNPPPGVDTFGMGRRCTKPIVMAVQGITFIIGIERLLAADIVMADNCRFAQLEPKRGLAVFGGAHVRYVERAGWGNAVYHLLGADEFDADRAKDLGFVQEVVATGTQVDRALAVAGEILECAALAVQETPTPCREAPATFQGR